MSLYSMTGFGKAQRAMAGRTIFAEIKSLNAKALDLSLRISPELRALEPALRADIAQKLVRGKVDVNIWIDAAPADAFAVADLDAVRHYCVQLKAIGEAAELDGVSQDAFFTALLRQPGVLGQASVPAEPTEEEAEAVRECLNEAIDGLIAFRRQEGQALERLFEEKLSRIEEQQQLLAPYEQGRVREIRARLEERLAALTGVDFDRGRLEQELIYYIEKLDISEERQRLTNHIAYFRSTIAEGNQAGVGKKLAFIAQEMGREINTTGSKSNQAEMQNCVVRMKDELEQIKEQVLNTL